MLLNRAEVAMAAGVVEVNVEVLGLELARDEWLAGCVGGLASSLICPAPAGGVY